MVKLCDSHGKTYSLTNQTRYITTVNISSAECNKAMRHEPADFRVTLPI